MTRPVNVIPLETSHAPMLRRTLLYTALTRARQLVVTVGQKKALYLAVRDWLRAPRHTTLGGLPGGTRRVEWVGPGGPSARRPAPRPVTVAVAARAGAAYLETA